MRTITCEDCGSLRKTTMPNTKYCTVCRVYRDILYFKPGQQRECRQPGCKIKYLPTSRRDTVCAKHDWGCSPDLHVCGICSNTATRWHPDLAFCVACAKDADLRGKVIEGFERRIREAREANAVPA